MKMLMHARDLTTRSRRLAAAAISGAVLMACGSDVSSRGSSGASNKGEVPDLQAEAAAARPRGPLGGLSVDSTGDAGTAGGGRHCATTSAGAMLVKQPVDIILVLDNSGSMADELAAAEQNINVNFAQILTAAAVDYRVILISRHRKDVRAMSGESSTSICVEAPLSGLAKCPSADEPRVGCRPRSFPTVFPLQREDREPRLVRDRHPRRLPFTRRAHASHDRGLEGVAPPQRQEGFPRDVGRRRGRSATTRKSRPSISSSPSSSPWPPNSAATHST